MGARKEPNPNTAYGRRRLREESAAAEKPKNPVKEKKVVPNKNEPNYTAIKFIFFGVIIVFALWRTYGVTDGKTSNPSTNSDQTVLDSDIPDEAAAYTIAQEFVKGRLKAPSTAEFRSTPAVFVKSPFDSTYKIQAFLDAQNSFGANLRQTFKIRMKYLGGDELDSGNWSVLSLDFGQN